MKRPRLLHWLTFIIFLAQLTIHTSLLSQFGINWDEPVHYIRGQIFLWYFLTGKKDFKDLPKLKTSEHASYRRSIYQYDDDPVRLTYKFFITDPDEAGHPPLSDIFASFSNYVFYQKLGVLGDIESYHLYIVFVGSLLVAGIFWFTATEYGLFAGIIATLSLFLYPLFFAEQHFNIKDPVEASFYGLALITLFVSIQKSSLVILLLSSLFAALALSTKFNILFAVFSVVPWFLLYMWKKNRWKRWPFSKAFTIGLLIYPVVAFGTLVSTWPYVWDDPIRRLAMVFYYYRDIGGTLYQPATTLVFGVVNSYALAWIVFSTPLSTLFLSIVGLVYVLRFGLREKRLTSIFVFLWLIVPVVRVSFFHAGIYGGLRQIMEFLPALAILSGIGAKQLVQWIRQKYVGTTPFLQGCMVLLFVPITVKLISIHPNQNVYMNPLIGGLAGAKEKDFPDWGVTLGSVYQQGIDWLNRNAQPNATASLIKGLLSNTPRIKIRPDINFADRYWSGADKKGEYLMEVTDYYFPRDISPEKRQYLETLRPVHEERVDGVPILTIWKNDWEHTIKVNH